MGHPMDGYYDKERDERERRWNRIHAMRVKLASVPLTAFTAGFTLAICIVLEPAILDKVVEKDRKIDEALDMLETFLEARSALGTPSLPG